MFVCFTYKVGSLTRSKIAPPPSVGIFGLMMTMTMMMIQILLLIIITVIEFILHRGRNVVVEWSQRDKITVATESNGGRIAVES